MMLEQRPATLACYLAFLAGQGIERPTAQSHLVLRQIALGRAWGFWPGPDMAENVPPCALAGIVHLDESEVWLVCGPGADRHLRALVGLFRAQLRQERWLIGRDLVTRVSVHNTAGQRLVTLLGFVDEGRREGDLMVWRLEWAKS
jgi:hypothetical protein